MFGINELSWTPFPNSLLFNAPQQTFKAEVSDIPASAGQQTNDVKWYSSTNSYWTSWGQKGGYSSTCSNNCDTVAKYLEVGIVKMRRNQGQGFNFLTLGPQDTFANGGTGGRSGGCADPNRKTNADGSCGADCKEGYEPDTTPNSGSECIAVNTDPNDCATDHRKVKDDETCGDCVSGYSENDDGDCVADEEEEGTNWMLWGGLAVVGVLAVSQIL